MCIIKYFTLGFLCVVALSHASPLRLDAADSVGAPASISKTRDVQSDEGDLLVSHKLKARDYDDENNTHVSGLRIKARDAGAAVHVKTPDYDENESDVGGLKIKTRDAKAGFRVKTPDYDDENTTDVGGL